MEEEEMKAINDDVDLEELKASIATERNMAIAVMFLVGICALIYFVSGALFHMLGVHLGIK